jgi:Zn-finger domain-containing protein
MVLRNELSSYGRESLKQVFNILKQERKGVVKTISMRIRFRDKNKRLIRRNISLGSEYVNNYDEEVRRRYGREVRIESLRFNRTKPAIIDDNHARMALAIGYVKYGEEIIESIKDEILKRRLTDFKRINKYDEITNTYKNASPEFIDQNDIDEIEDWRKAQIEDSFRKLGYIDKFGNLTRSLKRDLKIRENIYRNTLKNIASALIIWDIFKYYMTTSNNSRKHDIGPFPYIRIELDREQRKVFQASYTNVIETLNSYTDIKIIPIPEMDLLLYEKFKFEKEIRSINIKFNHVALGAALINLNSDIELSKISNAFNINESRVKKEIEHIDTIKNPKSDKLKRFNELIKK